MKNHMLFLLVACPLLALITYKLYAFTRFEQKQKSSAFSDTELRAGLQDKPLKHLGIIMDGNRRWAKQHGFKPWIGHRKGVDPIKETLTFCKEHGIAQLTLYVFSLENFKRPQEELSFLFDVLAQEIASKEMESLFKEGVCVRFIGDRTLFPAQLVPIITDIEQKTAHHSNLYLNLLFCYGGQQEIAAAANAVREQSSDEPVSWDTFKKYMWSADLPAIDLVIRTAGDQRLSNFLPMQSAYSELYFTSCFWPELTKEDLQEAVSFFLRSKRNLGT
jgi:undecaprenyl diphosphate synthase